MATNNERRKQKKREKDKKRKARKKKQAGVEQGKQTHKASQILPRLAKLCEGMNPTVIRLAAEDELTPAEIAERTGITAEEADAVVTEFTKLPQAIADKLVAHPQILGNPELMKLMTSMNASRAKGLLG
jgi:ATPase subunit of ABC transporter with duplicated ATPase domains